MKSSTRRKESDTFDHRVETSKRKSDELDQSFGAFQNLRPLFVNRAPALFQIATSICSGATTGLKMKQIKWNCQRSVHFERWRSWRRCFCNGMRMSILVQLFFGQLYVDLQIFADIRQSWQWHVYILFWRQREGWKFHQNWVKGHYSKHPLRLFRDFMNHKTFFNDFRIYETQCKGEPSTTF